MSYPQYTEAEAKQREQELCDQELQSRFGQEHRGQRIVIDPETGDYEEGDLMEAIAHIQTKNPGVHLYDLHIGFPESGRLVRRLYSYGGLCYKRNGANPTQVMLDDAMKRGAERYEQIRRQVEPGNERKTVIINTQTGEYTITDDMPETLKSVDMSSVITYTHRIGFLGTVSFGYRATRILRSMQNREKASGE